MQKDDRKGNPQAAVPGNDADMARAGANPAGADLEPGQGEPTWQQPWVRWVACLAVLFGLSGLIGLSATWLIAERGNNRVLEKIALDARRPPPGAVTQKNETGPDLARRHAAPAAPAAATLDFPVGGPGQPDRVPQQSAQTRPADNGAAAEHSCATAPARLQSGAAARRASRAGPAASPAARARAIRIHAALQRYRAQHQKKARTPPPAGVDRRAARAHSHRSTARNGRN